MPDKYAKRNVGQITAQHTARHFLIEFSKQSISSLYFSCKGEDALFLIPNSAIPNQGNTQKKGVQIHQL